jgi:2,3-diaminopropionate biosynthesis protein SbnB
MFDFHVLPGTAVSAILASSRKEILRLVSETYLTHEAGQSVNPDSCFLRFPDKPDARVIALPAYLGGEVDRIGIKWISSFPGNVRDGLPRASAVLVLNDYATGYPIACMEAAGISAARTAASAALAASTLGTWHKPCRAGFVGAGVIARTIADYLRAVGLPLSEVVCFDTDPASAGRLAAHAGGSVASTLDEALSCDVVVFATTAAEPHVPVDTRLRPGQVILNVSLRDLPPELLLTADNVLDDVDHCLKAQTSPHLAEQLTGSRDFVTGTLGQVLRGDVSPDPGRPVVFSPFGLGVLDIAVGSYVLTEAQHRGEAIAVPDFFGETTRW